MRKRLLCKGIIVYVLLFFYTNISIAACGNIPGSYPLYSSSQINLNQNINVNGYTVSSGTFSPKAAIDSSGNINTNINLSFSDLDSASFPSNNSTTSIISDSNISISNSIEVFYEEITLSKNETAVTFTGGGPFHVNKLIIKEENSTVNFAAGTYFINSLILEKSNTVINITSTPVILHIGTEFTINGENTDINKNGGVDDFRVYLHSNSKFVSKNSNLEFAGLIYGVNVNLVKLDGENSFIRGGIIVSGGAIEVTKASVFFTYTSADQSAISAISTCVGGVGSGDIAATEFNCVENGANAISGKLYTKTTGQPFSFDIVALKDASTVETDFAGGADHTVTVELVDASSGTCLTYSLLSSVVSQSLTFTSSDAGIKASASMTSSKAYRNVKCRITDATDSPSVVGCSTDAFAVRPTGFSVTSSLTNAGTSGAPTAKAGDTFTLTATAGAGYDGAPAIDNNKLQAHAGAVQTGTISGAFDAANATTGVAIGTGFTYSEVGSMGFAAQGIYDDSFTAIDQSGDCTADFSNTLVGGKVGCKFGNTAVSNYFGRFTPDHFDVTLNTPEFSPSCGTFTYVGQPVKYAAIPIATVYAKNASGTITQNYTGGFWKIDSTGITPSYSEVSHGLSVLVNSSPSASDAGDGTGTLSFADTTNNILAVTRSAPLASFNADIAMAFTLSDTDAIAVANVDGNPRTNPVSFGATTSGNGIDFSSGQKTHRWGRMAMDNAHGSELESLTVPLYAEYYNGASFVNNADDSCTSVAITSQLSLSNPDTASGANQPGNTAMAIGSGSSSATLANSPLSLGSAGLSFSAPGAGNIGSIDINTDFFPIDWLLFDWDSDSNHDDSPSGKATFGIYKGNTLQIYMREVY